MSSNKRTVYIMALDGGQSVVIKPEEYEKFRNFGPAIVTIDGDGETYFTNPDDAVQWVDDDPEMTGEWITIVSGMHFLGLAGTGNENAKYTMDGATCTIHILGEYN